MNRKKIYSGTLEFIDLYHKNKKTSFKGNKELADLLGFSSVSSITEILKQRANIAPDKLEVFKKFLLKSNKGKEQKDRLIFYDDPDQMYLNEASVVNGADGVFQSLKSVIDFTTIVRNEGDAMYPQIKDNEYLLVRLTDVSMLLPDLPYYIETVNPKRGFVRYVYKTPDEKDKLILRPENIEDFREIELNVSDIANIYIIKGLVEIK